MEATGIHHVGVAVDDLDAALATYDLLFGAQLEHRGILEDHLQPDTDLVIHLVYPSHIQTINRRQAPRYCSLIQAVPARTGVPVIVNTSFNVRGEPIVCTPEEAFNSFAHTDMDYLRLGDALSPAASKRRVAPYPGAQRVGTGVVA